MVNLLRYIWTNLHLPKKIYTGTARGARDKYQVCIIIIIRGHLKRMSQDGCLALVSWTLWSSLSSYLHKNNDGDGEECDDGEDGGDGDDGDDGDNGDDGDDGGDGDETDPEEDVGPCAVIVEVFHHQLVVVQRPKLTAQLVIIIIIIIITRPWPAFGRQGLVGSSGGYTYHGHNSHTSKSV